MVASNTVQTTINNATIAAVKSADKQFANVNDMITYTTTLTNNGNTLASNVFLQMYFQTEHHLSLIV